MSDQTPGPVPPADRAVPPPVPPVVPVAGQSAPPVPPVAPATGQPTPPPPRSRAWIWWTLGIVIVLGAIVASCTIPVVTMFRGTTSTSTSGLGNNIGIIRVNGVIAGTGSGFEGYVTPENFRQLLKRAEEDSSIKAVVLRVDSPGGTVAASEELAAYVEAFEKPVVVSIGDVGASGAYMLASQADEIWAMPGSAVGSIGVISQIPNVSGLLDKVGVEFQVITAGENKDTGSPYRDMTDEERALIQGEIDEVYDQFVGIVAKGRDMPESEVASLATGWAWNGEKAKELGLVDELGTLEQALDAAAKRANIGEDYGVIDISEPRFDQLFGSLLGVTRRLEQLGTLTEIPDTSTTGGAVVPR